MVLESIGLESSCIAASLLLSTTSATTLVPNDNHKWIVGQHHEGSNDVSEVQKYVRI